MMQAELTGAAEQGRCVASGPGCSPGVGWMTAAVMLRCCGPFSLLPLSVQESSFCHGAVCLCEWKSEQLCTRREQDSVGKMSTVYLVGRNPQSSRVLWWLSARLEWSP